MKSRFQPNELYRLRNHIPIRWLIGNVLKLEMQNSDARSPFRCPICAQFNTATNPSTNLARCFSCGKNFNTIDLVIHVRKLPFVDAVRFLQKCNARIKQQPIAVPETAGSPRKHSDLTALRDIIASLQKRSS